MCVPYCYLLLRKLTFAKMEQAYFAALNFHDLAKKYDQDIKVQ